ncbi:hypothetical protein Ahy_B09g094762 [Arachis hypogaea]|uniref:B-like cyclin n=1 Tax=Arachis hypogaea TaxID=3818 RepID=A0A444XCR8_ARAHY|nr:hypothetical protein Ahy_B09g094762 [Arachis hypogaea]
MKENSVTLKAGELPCRLTRARAAAFRASGQLPPLKEPAKQKNQKQPQLRANPKRAVSDNACLQRKKRAVLQDVTNVFCENTYRSCFNSTKIQGKKSKLAKASRINVSKVAPSAAAQQHVRVHCKTKSFPEPGLKSEDASCSINSENNALIRLSVKESGKDDKTHVSGISPLPLISQKKAKKCSPFPIALRDPEIANIDDDNEDPQLCSLYAADIYNTLRVYELARRPNPNFMDTKQHDITQSMRGILVDWLVEVSEEYRLGLDTLYLTVYLIDWFLSRNYIERQRLQLLGITCMLIASKYEEINAPRIEDFCYITDNTYTKAESPSLELEYLANYLAELTLMEYSFLNFLPSTIAASAVFLAKWTLDQSKHPWSPTLQHYACYKASDLKTTVLALQDLQLNINGCPLTAIRSKYSQDKFKYVGSLSPPKLPETMF